jgi:Cys-tRNA(Pro)/Cys-tRNA(Cys) deacylase
VITVGRDHDAMAGSATPATTMLTRLGIEFTVHTYEHDRGTEQYGDEAVDALSAGLGVSADRVFKTLVVSTGSSLAVAVLPVPDMLALKSVAAALGASKVSMADPAAVRRSTGYVLGGVSPLGQRTPLPTVVDTSALGHSTLFCSGGRRGLEIELSAQDLVRATAATVADIRRASASERL